MVLEELKNIMIKIIIILYDINKISYLDDFMLFYIDLKLYFLFI